MSRQAVSLLCTEAGSNKEYHAELLESDGGWVVKTRHGPAGRATVLGTKTPAPVTLEKAEKIFKKLIADKMGGGYRPIGGQGESIGGDAVRELAASMPEKSDAWRPALLIAVGPEKLDELLDDEQWVMSEKIDGERRGVHVMAPGAQGVVGMNRKAEHVPVQESWKLGFSALPVGTILDGELFDSRLHVFDAVQIGQTDLRRLGYEERLSAARKALHEAGLLGPHGSDVVRVVATARSSQEKRAMLREISARTGEGTVFRFESAPYEAGRSVGAIKYKFLESSTCIVRNVNEGKRSVGLDLLDVRLKPLDVGNVTIPANHPIPEPGALVEVRYMHLFAGGSLYQPVYLGERKDVSREECLLSQVRRLKSGAVDSPDAEERPERPYTVSLSEDAGDRFRLQETVLAATAEDAIDKVESARPGCVVHTCFEADEGADQPASGVTRERQR